MGFISAAGTIEKGQSDANALLANSAQATANAENAQLNGDEVLKQQKRGAAMQIGQERATYGASGVDSTEGSALQVLKQSAAQAALDSLNIQRSTAAKVSGYTNQAASLQNQAQGVTTASQWTAAGQFASTYGMFAGG